MPRKRTAAPKRKLTHERFAAGRAERYAQQTNNVAPMMHLETEIRCPGCEKGHGVIIGTQARRTLLECNYCLRQFFPSTMERP